MRTLVALARPLVVAALLSSGLTLAADGGELDGGLPDGGEDDAGDAGGNDAGADAGRVDGGAPDDAGALDAGPIDAGVPPVVDAGGVDAGPTLPIEEGRVCTLADGANCGALYCVPDAIPDSLVWWTGDDGVCRTGCDDDDDCFPGRTCQDVVDKATFEVLYRACVPPVTSRDYDCLSPLAPDACGEDFGSGEPMSCHVARGSDSPDGVSFNCKVTCDLDAEPDAGACPIGEACFSPAYVQGFEPSPTDPDGRIACTPALCDDRDAACECSDGFSCVTLSSGDDVCAYLPGECGTPVRGMVPGEIEDGTVPFDVQCNTTTDHRFCDNSGFEDLEDPGANICFFAGELGVPDEGICLPYCGVVDVDSNANGVLEDAERGRVLDCPTGEQCTKRLARELLLGPGPVQSGGPYGLRGCSLTTCPPGTVCPTCGLGQPECMALPSPVGGFDGICIGPVLTCEAAPDYDAGPLPGEDAGAPPSDAGTSTGDDAGGDPPVGQDAGTGGDDDAGKRDEDGRLDDTPDPTVTTDGCACSSGAAGGSGQPVGLALLLVGLLIAARSRSRRR